jgi:uncharacterized protein YcfL
MAIFASALAIAFAGCITDTSGIAVEKGKMTVYNQRLAAHMSLTHHLRRDTKTGFVHVQAVLQNADYGDIQFQYRFEWYDADGMLIEETSPMWHTARVHGKDRKVLEGVSESRQAADFRLVVRAL